MYIRECKLSNLAAGRRYERFHFVRDISHVDVKYKRMQKKSNSWTHLLFRIPFRSATSTKEMENGTAPTSART